MTLLLEIAGEGRRTSTTVVSCGSLKRAEVAAVEGWDTETKMREVAEGSMRCERRRIERSLRDGDKQARRKETLPTSEEQRDVANKPSCAQIGECDGECDG